jgi:hypothetical protein
LFIKAADFSVSEIMDWQSIIAAGIVVVTLTIFLVRMARPRRKSGCGHGCGCEEKFRKSG